MYNVQTNRQIWIRTKKKTLASSPLLAVWELAELLGGFWSIQPQRFSYGGGVVEEEDR
jgi:hypothetical protein